MYSNKYFSIVRCSKQTCLKILFWLFTMTAIFVLLTIYSPTEYVFRYLGFEETNGCILLTFLGIPCPVCGMGRSLPALMEFDFGKMIYYNPSSVAFYCSLFLMFASVLVPAVTGHRFKFHKSLMKFWYVAVLILAFVWILNILYGNHNAGLHY